MTIYNDISSSNLEIHHCVVERCHKSGLIDARSNRDKAFEQINTLFFAAEANYCVGDQCIVVTDGTQHYVFGQVIDPQPGDDGQVTTRNLNNDLADLTDSKALVAQNEFGSQAKIVASPGGGVILDSGENAMTHMDPGNNKIAEIADRKETVTVPVTVDADHDGVTASTKIKCRTTADTLSWDRDMARERNDSLDTGPTVTFDVGPAPEVFTMEYLLPGGQKAAKIDISETGAITIEGVKGVGKVEIKEGEVKITSVSGASTATLDSNGIRLNAGAGNVHVDKTGRLKLGNDVVDLVDLFSQTLIQLSGATTPTIYGFSPLVQAAVFGTYQVQLQAING